MNILELSEARAKILSGGADAVLAGIEGLPRAQRADPDLRDTEAMCLTFLGEHQRATAIWQSLLEDGYWNPQMLEHHCACLMHLQDYEAIENVLADWLAEDEHDHNPRLFELFAEALLLQNKISAAQELVAGATEIGASNGKSANPSQEILRTLSLRIEARLSEPSCQKEKCDQTELEVLIAERQHLYRRGFYKEAVLVQKRIIAATDENDVQQLLYLHDCHLQDGNVADAEHALADALESFPDSEFAMTTAVEHFIDQRELSLAGAWFCQLENNCENPDSDELKSLAASLAVACDDLIGAEELLAKLPETHVKSLDARVGLYSKTNQPALATYFSNQRIMLNDRSVRSLLQGARLAIETGDHEAAEALCAEALLQRPNSLSAAAMSLRLGKSTNPLATVVKIQTALLSSHVDASLRARLCFDLADFYHNAKNYTVSGTFYEQANRIAGNNCAEKYSSSEHTDNVAGLIAQFPVQRAELRHHWDSQTSPKDPNTIPVFIIGMPRSGTTLTEQILARHPQCIGMGERPYFSKFISEFLRPQNLTEPDEGKLASINLGALASMPADYEASLHAHVKREAMTSSAAERRLYIDKLPDNYQHLGWIREVLPQSKIVYVRRDPREILLSCWRAHFGAINWAFEPETIALRIREHYRLMAFWFQEYGDSVLTVHYHDLVTATREQTLRMLEFLDLPWHPDCLEPSQATSVVRTASVQQVRQPVFATSLGNWKHYESKLEAGLSILQNLDDTGTL